MAEVYEVSQINEYLRQRFEADEFLGSLLIRGELSNYKIYPSGHHYFTLKDSQSAIRCVMFKGSAMRLRFRPETGMKVIAGGRIAVFPRDGAYQLYCTSLTPEGVGDLHVAFEQLKLKLQAEGLFARERKQALPRFPHRIAIITSSAGAALHDMLRTGYGESIAKSCTSRQSSSQGNSCRCKSCRESNDCCSQSNHSGDKSTGRCYRRRRLGRCCGHCRDLPDCSDMRLCFRGVLLR